MYNVFHPTVLTWFQQLMNEQYKVSMNHIGRGVWQTDKSSKFLPVPKLTIRLLTFPISHNTGSLFQGHVLTYRVFIKYCIFSKKSRKFANSPSPALGCYWLYKKLPANMSDCTLALR